MKTFRFCKTEFNKYPETWSCTISPNDTRMNQVPSEGDIVQSHDSEFSGVVKEVNRSVIDVLPVHGIPCVGRDYSVLSPHHSI